jgi:hypothetical protein
MVDRLFFSGEEMSGNKHKLRRRLAEAIVAVILVAALATAISLTRHSSPPTEVSYSRKIFPGQTYLAWDDNPQPPGYVFRAIHFDMYVNGSVVLGSGTNQSSWTCPEYVYGQEGNPRFKVDYSVARTESVRSS